MINNIKTLFNRLMEEDIPKKEIDFETALAALLVEVMRADGEVKVAEINKIHSILLKECGLDGQASDNLIEKAKALVEEAIDLFSFVTVINEHTSDVERIDIIELLWHVALADDEIDGIEEHIIRKIAGLMYVAHADFIAAKLAVVKS